MSIKETSANAANVTAVNSGLAGAAGWVDENHQMLMLAIAASSLLIGTVLGILNHLERRKATDHLVNGTHSE